MLASCRKFYPILLATLWYISTMNFFIFSVSAFGSELMFSALGNGSPKVHYNFNIADVFNAHALLRVLEQ